MLPEVRTILYASDLGESARPAFRMAVSLARQHDAEITFLHAIEPLSQNAQNVIRSLVDDELMKEMQRSSLDNLRSKLEARILRFCEEELDGTDFPHGKAIPRVEEGHADKVILQVAQEIDADLIVMGTRNHSSSLGQLLMGSTANKVIHQSSRPVLVVPLPKG